MALRDIFKNLNRKVRKYYFAKLLNGTTPVFSQFGQNIYMSDIVQTCIDRIATEISKLQPKHIYTGSDGIQRVPKSTINRLFKVAPNQFMTTRDFLEKITWLLYLNYNCFIYPTYNLVKDVRGNHAKVYTGFYPLDPTRVEFLQDASGRLFTHLYFNGGNNFTIPYSDMVHLRKKFSVNSMMGGGPNGLPDNTALLKLLETDDIVLQGIGKAIKTSMSVKLITKINTMLDDDKQKAERKRLEDQINSGNSAILATDLKADYTPITIDPKIIDKETMSFIQNRILAWHSVSLPIFLGNFTDEDYQAFWETPLNGLAVTYGQAFSKALFTPRQIDVGNLMQFYQQDAMFLSTKSKLKMLEIMGAQGLLTDAQKLAIMGYGPPEDGSGNRKTVSLNYINIDIADEYQLRRAGIESKGDGVNGKKEN